MSIEPARLVDSSRRSRVSTFQSRLPPDVVQCLSACEAMNVADANATLVEWKRRAHWEGKT